MKRLIIGFIDEIVFDVYLHVPILHMVWIRNQGKHFYISLCTESCDALSKPCLMKCTGDQGQTCRHEHNNMSKAKCLPAIKCLHQQSLWQYGCVP